MDIDPKWNVEVPTQIRQVAEQSVEQAKKAVDGFLTAAQKAAVTVENQVATAQRGAKDVSQKMMGFVEQNIASSFDFAQRLVRAKDLHEIMALQTEFIKSQMQAMTEQTKELGSKAFAAAEATKPHSKQK